MKRVQCAIAAANTPKIATKIIPYEGLKQDFIAVTQLRFVIATKIIPYEGLKRGNYLERERIALIATKIIPYEGLKRASHWHLWQGYELQLK